MEKNIKDKILKCNLKSASGITLVALVVTIIVLLILAAVSLSAVFSQDGIFSRAEQATEKYGQAKARETLELVLNEFQITKYEEGLSGENYENRLDSKISEVGSLIPKEDESSNYQLVIVDGHIFEVDRSVPKIVDYKGPADGIIITAKITQNGDWQNPVVTVTGTITKYGSGSVISSTATATEGVTITGFPTTGGNYTISNITKDTDITITASADDGKPAVTKTIKVRLIRDNTPPVISGQEAILSAKTEIINGMKIRIKANAVDDESGLASLTYKIEPNTIKDGKAEGTLTSGTSIEVEATEIDNYTVTFTAKDNANNTATATAGPVRASDAMSVESVKNKVNISNIRDYIGIKVDYQSPEGGNWRIFYCDPGDDTHPNGFFGDGKGTIYLKRDSTNTSSPGTQLTISSKTSETDPAVARFYKMNPLLAASKEHRPIDKDNEKACVWLCDGTIWNKYKTEESSYAIGSPSLEMYIKAYNQWSGTSDTLIYKLDDTNSKTGYLVGSNGTYWANGYLTRYPLLSDSGNAYQLFIPYGTQWWLASPSGDPEYENINVIAGQMYSSIGRCPVTTEYKSNIWVIVPLDG